MKLLKTLIALTLALCTALTHAADADPPAVVGRLNYISGPVSFAPAQANEDWSAAELNRPITTGDRLWTDTNGRAEMHVGSLAIRMGAQTSLDVLALDERTLQLRLAQGSMNLRVRRLASDKLLEIATPSGAVVVKQPGSYRINVDSSGAATMVAVRGGGQAEVFTGNSSFAIRDNQEAEISGSRQDLFAASPPDDFDRWTAGRDEREDRVVSTRYVPEEMTGYEDLDHYGAWRTAPDYGPVWVPTAVPAGWAPYRTGHWVWIAPWGWTWVDSAPWGFAPFHYGRWVWLGNHWAWAPGRRTARPVYAPALVAFIGGSNFSVSVSAGPAVGWVPLGWREPYRPWYRASHAYVRNVNVTHVTNVTNITNNITNVRLVNRNAPSAVTVVSRENFIAARRADQAALRVNARTLAAAPLTQGAPVAAPARTSFARAERGAQPPATARTRETVAVNTPPAPARAAIREAREDARNARVAGNDERPRVRVINRAERVNLQQATDSQRAGARAPQAQSPAETPRVTQEQSQAGPVGTARNERSPETAVRPQSTPQPAQAGRSERAPERAAPQSQPQPNQQAERRAPGPPPEVSRRPTFDRDMRPSTAEARREQRQAERQADRREQREQPSVPSNDLPRPQAAQPDTRTTTTPRPAQDAPRAQQLEQQQQARDEQARSQQARQRAQQQREQQQTQQRQQQAEQQQGREQQARQRQAQQQNEERQRAQQQREQQQAQQRQQQAEQQQAREQQVRQREAQQQNVERQRAQQQREQQQAQQRQQQAQAQQAAREQQARQREQQQQQQRAQQQQRQQQIQAQQAAREQQPRQREAQQQQREQRQDERAERRVPQPQAAPAAERRAAQQQRAEDAREKGRDRQRADRDKG